MDREVVGYSPRGHKESDMTQHTHTVKWGRQYECRAVGCCGSRWGCLEKTQGQGCGWEAGRASQKGLVS